MSNVEIVEVHQYYPNGVQRIIARGGGCYIGLIDEVTVLKYPRQRVEASTVQIESQLLQILGTHPRIITFKGQTGDGIRLEYAPNGDLNTYIISESQCIFGTKTPVVQTSC
jgi:hypothetical protein